MNEVRDILARKGHHLNTISATATVHTAAISMNDHRIGSLLILDEGRVLGILTERDILEKIVAPRRDPAEVRVEEVMTRDVVCCRNHTEVEEARRLMKTCRVRHLPVLDDVDLVIGVVSIGDLNAHQVTHQEQTIYLLHEYIQGRA